MLSLSLTTIVKADGTYCPLPNSDNCANDLATCRLDCKAIISAAETEISALNTLVTDQKTEITDLHTSLGTIAKDRDSDKQSLSSWYHSPWVLIPVGVVIGGIVVDRLEHR